MGMLPKKYHKAKSQAKKKRKDKSEKKTISKSQ
jgi:hypothetical protein